MGEIIRRAVVADIPRLVELGFEFATLSQPIHRFNVSRGAIIFSTNQMVQNNDAVVLVLEVDGVIQGVIAGVIQKIFFSEDVALQELVWYVKNGFKGTELLKAFEVIAIGIGCQALIVGNKPAYCDLGKYYERQGFTFLENHYTKRLL